MTIVPAQYHSLKHRRRTATAVLAGDFDPRPARDVLTSVLNGVPRYEAVEGADAASKRSKKMEQRDRDRERLRAKRAEERAQREAQAEESQHQAGPSVPAATAAPAVMPPPPPVVRSSTTPVPHVPTARLGIGRPAIHMTSTQRSVSVTPPPMPSSPASTPQPSISSSTSRQSSKRPRTPDDGEDLHPSSSKTVVEKRPPKKRVAARKGWKGWVEGSPPPSDKLINLDFAPILTSRRTRSGKSFDG